jgi:hypothetical protein
MFSSWLCEESFSDAGIWMLERNSCLTLRRKWLDISFIDMTTGNLKISKIPLTFLCAREVLGILLLLICRSVAFSSAAKQPAELFISARAGTHSPALQLDFARFAAADTASKFNTIIAEIRNAGFGSLMLTGISPGSNSWNTVFQVAEHCRDNDMRLECRFFPQTPSTPALREIRCDVREVGFNSGDREMVYTGRTERIAGIYRPLPSANNDVMSTRTMVVAGKESLPRSGRWREYQFYEVPVDPLTVDYLDTAVLVPAINTFLLNAQRSMHGCYGRVFQCINFPLAKDFRLVWSDGLPRWYHQNMSFDYIRALPQICECDFKDSENTSSYKQRFSRGLEKLWREKFCMNVYPLVKEAGLEASVVIERLPLPPEEAVCLFQVPILNGSANLKHRIINRRAGGAARLMGRLRIVGCVNPISPERDEIVKNLLMDGATQILFCDNDSQFFCAGLNESTDRLIDFVNRCCAVINNSEPVHGVLCCAEHCDDDRMRLLSFDCVTPRMLQDAEIGAGKIIFSSGHGGSTLIADLDRLGRYTGLVERLKESDITVIPPSKISELPAVLVWHSTEEQMDVRYLHRRDLDREYFLIHNESNAEGMLDLQFRVDQCVNIERWQPHNGAIYSLKNYKQSNLQGILLSTPVRSREMFFIVIRKSGT